MDLIRTYTKILKDKFQRTGFQNDVDQLFLFYYKKCTVNLDAEKDAWIFDSLDKMFNLKFLQGYLTLSETLKMNEDLITEPTGSVTYEEVLQEIPDLIRELFEEHEAETLNVRVCDEFAIDVLTEKDQELYEVINQAFKEIAYYGICYAYIHKYEDYIVRNELTNLTAIEGTYFLTPQVYITPSPSDDVLKYEIFGWPGSVFNKQWLGRVQFNPYKKEEDSILAEIMLSDLIGLNEKAEIIEVIKNLLTQTTKALDNENPILINLFNISSINTHIVENTIPQA